ncbi:MAG: DUF3048 domain-containing protein [Clostridia bacterium]|nr:DUF3048 domain-containing protein [Clostridia bacterium]
MKRLILTILAFILALSGVAFAEELPTIEDTALVPSSATTGYVKDEPDQIIVVQIDNEPGARPQLGISYADIIYEMVVYSGGYTRYTAVYNDTIPEKVEAVRSARMLNVDMYLEYGGAFVHFGGQEYEGTSVFDYFETVNMQARYDGLEHYGFFYRDDNREAPNNVVARLQKIADDVDWANVECTSPLRFSETDYTAKGEPVSEFSINYRSGYAPSYEYSDGIYYRNYNNSPHKDGQTGEQLTCSNVIVQHMEYEWFEGASDRPLITSVGSGKCDYFIDGMHFTGYWERSDLNESTVYYDDEGCRVYFKPGKTFIQIISETEEVAIAE